MSAKAQRETAASRFIPYLPVSDDAGEARIPAAASHRLNIRAQSRARTSRSTGRGWSFGGVERGGLRRKLPYVAAVSPRAEASPGGVLSGRLSRAASWVSRDCLVRAQIFSQLLFVPLFLLLRRESRRPSRRVLIVFPLLALWANLHGAVVVGVALVAALGATELLREARKPKRSARALARAGALIV